MDFALGGSQRTVVAGSPRPRSRYGMRPDGSRGPVGVEQDASGVPLSAFTGTLAGGVAGWVEGATLVLPEPLAAQLPATGGLVELSGDLRMSVRGGDFGATRVTITGVSGVRTLGSAVDILAGVGVGSREKAAAGAAS